MSNGVLIAKAWWRCVGMGLVGCGLVGLLRVMHMPKEIKDYLTKSYGKGARSHWPELTNLWVS